ncbi:hypothetical protein CN167_30360 [Sinorhizobium medicae]|nr:hypothetical protein CN167_30360 [Sinorhizobium medicae]RVK22187.1 hypothetical protein CN165_05275 [Sinorhizobium medicae]
MHGFHVHNPCSMFRFVLILGAHTRGMGHHPSRVALAFNSPFKSEWRAVDALCAAHTTSGRTRGLAG